LISRNFMTAIVLALTLSACAKNDAVDKAVPSMYAEVIPWESDGPNPFSSFVAASLAMRDNDDRLAASYYLEALNNAPDNQFITEKAFLQLVTSGMINDAAGIAAQINTGSQLGGLANLTRATVALKEGDAEKSSAAASDLRGASFGFIFQPLFDAWSAALNGDDQVAIDILKGLGDRAVLRSLRLEHKAYIYDYLGKKAEAEAAYQSLIYSDEFTGLQPVIAYSDFLYRQNRGNDARQLIANELKKNKEDRFLLREAQSLMMGRGPSLRAATPEGAMANFYYRMAAETMQQGPNLMTIIYGRMSEFLAPDNDDTKLLLGDALMSLERYGEATRSYDAIVMTSPIYKTAVMRNVSALLQTKAYTKAADLMINELKSSPNNRVLLTSIAEIYREAGRCEDAIPYYDRIITSFSRKNDRIWQEYFSRGACYEELGDWEKAKMDLYTAKDLNPDNAMVLNYLGYSLLIRDEKLEEALGFIQIAAEKEPENGSVIDSLGWLQYRTGDTVNALISLEKAVRLSPDNSTINDHLGDVYWAVGRRREARFQWQHALTLLSSKDDLKRLKDKLEFGLGFAQKAQ